MHKIIRVEALVDFQLLLTFEDGTTGSVDLSDLAGKGVFSCWNSPEAFREVKIGDTGELVWGEQVDLCPDSLYIRVTGKAPEEVFPALRRPERVHARAL